MARQLPEFMRTEEAMYKWAEDEAADFFDEDLDADEVREAMEELVQDYRDQAKKVLKAGEVVCYRYIRVLEDRWQERINWNCLGKYWSWELDGAGVQEGPSGEGPWVDVLLVGRLKFEDIDWEHGFYSYIFYTDQREIAAEANRPVVVEAVGLKPRWGEKPNLQKLKPPVKGNVGPVEIDNWSEVCEPAEPLNGFSGKGDPTDLNLWVLERLFQGKTTAPNAMKPSSKAHIRRCWQAGLLTVDGPQLHLTEKGKAVLGMRASKGDAANDNLGVYDVDGREFDSFMAAVRYASERRAEVYEVREDGSRQRRWAPGVLKKPKTRHVIVNPDGTLKPFTKVRR